jgi:hypothetical protein
MPRCAERLTAPVDVCLISPRYVLPALIPGTARHITARRLPSESSKCFVEFLPVDADIACWVWVFGAPYSGITLDQYPNLKAWHDKILDRPAVNEGINIPTPNPMLAALEDPEKMKEMVESGQSMMIRADKVTS